MNPLINLIKHFVYFIRDLRLPKYKPVEKEKSLAILRLDAIGDYILFRNFIEIIKGSKKYQEYTITLVGNEVWKTIAEALDAQWVDRFIWINTTKFQKDFDYRKFILAEVEDTHYSVLFHPTYSRDFFIAETIAKRIHAKKKIASCGDTINITQWQKSITDKIYEICIDFDSANVFEFEQNKAIVGAFIEEDFLLKTTSISTKSLSVFLGNSSNYFVLFVGGSAKFKHWSENNWIELISKLLRNFTEDLVIAGGPDDKAMANLIFNHFAPKNPRILNYCGKTSLLELITLIERSRGIISNETSAAHMAVALDVPVLVLGNGNHYGRFNPYPKSMTINYKILYPKEIENESDENVRIKKYGKGSNLDINTISVARVIAQSKELLTP